jgi:hypothetical protein
VVDVIAAVAGWAFVAAGVVLIGTAVIGNVRSRPAAVRWWVAAFAGGRHLRSPWVAQYVRGIVLVLAGSVAMRGGWSMLALLVAVAYVAIDLRFGLLDP